MPGFSGVFCLGTPHLAKTANQSHIVWMDQSPTLDLMEQQRHRALNRFHTVLLIGGSLGLLGVTAYVFSGLTGVVLAMLFGAMALMGMQRVSPKLVLSMYKAQPAGPDVFPAGHRIVQELAARANLPATPSLNIVPSRMMNAFAVGKPEDSAIAITDALARQLSLRELTGVLAHEISHIANEDLKVMALADIVTRYTSIMSLTGWLSLVINLGGVAGGYGPGIPWFAVLLLLGAPTIGSLLQLALSRTREFDADLNAAILTGDPDGLASALTKLERAQGKLWEGMVLPGGRLPDPSILRSHPVTEERIRRLMALKTPDGLAIPQRRARRVSPAVPSIRTPDGRALERDRYAIIAKPDWPFDDEAAAPPATPEPGERPRIRVRRGGVWW